LCWQCDKASNAILRCFLSRLVSLRRTESLADEMVFNVLATESQRRGRFCPATASSGLLSSMSTSQLAAVAFPLGVCELVIARLLRNDLMMNAQGLSWEWEYAYSFGRMYCFGGGVLLLAAA
jgi:hypothetical protein